MVFDTNALYVVQNSLGSASDLVRAEIANLISGAKYPDLDILWYLPEVVRHERQYQMQAEALKLRGSINRIERLLNHNLALSDQVLLDHVKMKIDEAKDQLGLQELPLDHRSVDWPSIIHAAEYRIAPFEPGEKEKGFRDALVVESFLQLAAGSPRTPDICRIALVTSDVRLTQAVNARVSGFTNVSVLANIEELKGLINTIVSNVDEGFIALLQPKAAKLFFVSSSDQNTLYFREKVGDTIRSKFAKELEALPEGTAFRRNGTWYVSRPNFSRKEQRRVFWASRIEVEVEAGKLSKDDVQLPEASVVRLTGPTTQYYFDSDALLANSASVANASPLGSVNLLPTLDWTQVDWTKGITGNWAKAIPVRVGSDRSVVTHKGRDVFEVLWSANVTMSKDLSKPKIEDVRHIGLSCQPTQ